MVKEHFLNWAFIEMPQETLIDQIDPNNQRPDQSQDPLIGHSLLSQLGIRDRGLFHPTTHLTKSVFPLLYNLALKKIYFTTLESNMPLKNYHLPSLSPT